MALSPNLRNALFVPFGAVVLALFFDTFMFGIAWQDNTVVSHARYLNLFPLVWKPVAVGKMDDLLFQEACAEDTPEAYRLYLRSSPNKGHQEEALTREDESLFAWADSLGSVTALGRYVRELPEGRHVEEAEQLIAEKSNRAFEAYEEGAVEKGADRRALDTMLAVSGFIQKTGQRSLQLTFEVANDTGISDIRAVNLGKSEKLAVEEISEAFGRMFPGGIIDIQSVAEADTDKVHLHVGYKLSKTGISYSSDGANPMAYSRTFDGVRFDWTFNLVVPDGEGRPYAFEFSTNPADHFEVSYKKPLYGGLDMGPSTDEVYDAMIATAFRDFQKEFMDRFGF